MQGGVACEGELAAAYRACLGSRLGLRVLWQIAHFPVADATDLYAGVRDDRLAAHLDVDGTLAVDFSGNVPGITHTQFGAQRVKDAIVDQFREATGTRPSVDRESPTVRINVHAARGALTLAIDLSGDSLHRRGYRGGQGAAPLKENLAAAILLRAGWPAIAAAGGVVRRSHVRLGDACHRGRADRGRHRAGPPARALRLRALEAARRRGLGARFAARRRARSNRTCSTARPHPGLRPRSRSRSATPRRMPRAPASAGGIVPAALRARASSRRAPAPQGLVAVNPPYGERIGETEELRALYALLGERLRADYRGWEAAVFTGNPALGRELGINARRTHRMMNGPIECRLLRLTIERRRLRAGARAGPAAGDRRRGRPRATRRADVREPAAEEYRPGLRRGPRREQVSCFRALRRRHARVRLRDRPLPVGSGGSAGRWLYVQEYAPPATVDKDKARARREEAISALPEVTGPRSRRDLLAHAPAAEGRSRSTRRWRTSTSASWSRRAGLKFLVNFTDYLDTGLFLDHRKTRKRDPRRSRKGKRFLNLFCYTGAVTVYAAAGGGGLDDERRHVAHLPRLGEAQPRRERHRRPRTRSSRKTASPGSPRPRPRRSTSSSSIRPRSRTPSAWSASSTCSATTWS